MKRTKFKLVLASTVLAMSLFAQTNNGQHKIVKKIDFGGEGTWDYLAVDESAQRLFLSHAAVVNVIDLKTDKVLATIPDTKGVHGIAIANDLSKGFTSNGKDTSITVFDLKSLTVIEKVKIKGIKPDAILYDIFSHKVFVFNGKSYDATVMDAKTNKVVETIKLDGKPEFSATDEKGTIFVNIEDKNSITAIDVNTLKVKSVWSIAPGEEPTGLALDVKNHRLFAVCSNKLMVVVNSDNGKVITTIQIGDNCDGIAFDSDKGIIFTSNGDGTVTVVKQQNENTYKVIETIQVQKKIKTITLNKTTHQVYVPTADFMDIPEANGEKNKSKPVLKPNTFAVLIIE